MASFFGSALGALGSLAGGILGGNQARDDATTAYNRTRELDQWLAQNQIQWRVSDLEKAGLNKVLAAPGALGGIGTQVAPMAQGGGSSVASGASSAGAIAAQAAAQAAGIEQVKAQARATSANAAMTEATTPSRDQFNRMYEANIAAATTGAGEAAARIGRIDQELVNMQEQWRVLQATTEEKRLSNEQAARMQDLVVKGQELTNQLTAAKIPEAQAMAAAWQGVLAAAKKIGLDPANPSSWTTTIDLAKDVPGDVARFWSSFKGWLDSRRTRQ